MASFVHLRLHSEYSIADSIITIDGLIERLCADHMPAVALTDQSNLFAAIKFYQAAQSAGIKPILGVDLWVQNPSCAEKPYRLTLLCQNRQGYGALTRLISRSYTDGQIQGLPTIEQAWLKENSEGLLALSGSLEGDIGQALLNQQMDVATERLKEWMTFFPGRFYIEIQRVNKPNEETYNQAAVQLASVYKIPIVATNDVRFLDEDDMEAHEARVCIQEGFVLNDTRRPRRYTSKQYLRSSEEMAVLFQDMPEALENTVEIAKKCNLSLPLGQVFLPKFPISSGESTEEYFFSQAKIGLQQRLQASTLTDTAHYWQRLSTELDVIHEMGFAGYFLIVADFIQWAKQQRIPVGPGRGSGAGSLVAYALGITDIDPLPYDLLFERFLNPERVSMPDFDVDFCMDGRDRVIDYVAEKYGRGSVSQIITYGSMAAKAVIRDVGRVLGHPYGFVDKLAKLIPFELGITLEKALAQEAELSQRYDREEEVKILFDLAMKLEGLVRNAGKHAGGVVISPSLLTDFAPLYCETGGDNLVTQFDKDDVEAVGLVKFDFLGLRTLTIIAWAVDTINLQLQKKQALPITVENIPLDDKSTYDLIKACATTAVFQLESRGMKDLIKRLQPDNFEEIIALVALFRPGPLQSGMVEDFINRKHGREKVEYSHPSLEPILRPTYGIIVYQEQVMQIAQVLGGYTLGGADLLRRAMGKKKPEEMAKHREIFVNGAKKQGVEAEIASTIFDLMEKFAGYGFNKSHSAAYALVSYQTAWLKAHYPAEFMAAVLSSDMDKTDKVVGFLQECRRLRLAVVPPNINRSEYRFTVTLEGEILYGLGAIKGAGEAAIHGVLSDRREKGPFVDLFDFCRRIDTRKVNRRVLESLIKSGTLDCFAMHRAALIGNLDGALQAAEQHAQQALLGQQDLFGLEEADEKVAAIQIDEWHTLERLQGEKLTLGFYHTGHPLQLYESELSQFVSLSIADVDQSEAKNVTVAGMITQMRTMFTKRGSRMAFVALEDRSGSIELTVFSELLESNKEAMVKDALIVVEGEISVDDFSGSNRLLAKNIYSLAQMRDNYAKALLLKMDPEILAKQGFGKLAQTLMPYQSGICPIYIRYSNAVGVVRLQLGEEWKVQLTDELLHQLRLILGDEQVQVCY